MITSVGAYLLGALDPADRAVFQAHLAGCPVCEAELLRMAPLPGLLQRIDEAEFAEPAPRAEPGRPVAPRGDPLPIPARPRRSLVAAVAVAVVVALGGLAAYQALRPPDAPTVTWSATNPASGIGADIDLTSRPWGTEVRIRMRDVPPGKPCKLVVRARDGSREVAGWWAAGTTAEEEIPGSTSFDIAAIDRVEVISGETVVIDLTPPD